MVDFQSNRVLDDELTRFESVKACELVSKKVFETQTNITKGKRPKSFYELGRKIRYQIPIVLDNAELEGYLKYIGLPATQIRARDCFGRWKPSDKQRKLEGTTWLLYYFHRGHKKHSPEGRGEVSSVARAILKFLPFGKAEIIGFDSNETYEGTFKMYDGEKFISFEMQLKDKVERDLRGIIYVGTGEVSLALGQFHNAHKGINSGTLMIEQVTPKNVEYAMPRYFDEQGVKDLPGHVQKYFSNKKDNMLRVPTSILSLPEFDAWHAQKNGK